MCFSCCVVVCLDPVTRARHWLLGASRRHGTGPPLGGGSSPGYARGVRERDSENSVESSKRKALRCSQRVFSTNSRALSHDRAMLVRGGSWTNGTTTCVGLSTYFLGRRSLTGKLPAMSEWRYLSSREVHFLSRTRPWHTHSHAHLCSCLEALHRDGCNEYPRTNFDIACHSG